MNKDVCENIYEHEGASAWEMMKVSPCASRQTKDVWVSHVMAVIACFDICCDHPSSSAESP